MLQRLGQVLYWTGCGAAAVVAIGAVASLSMDNLAGNWPLPVFLAFVAGCLYALGRACRYVLAGT